MKNCIKNQHSYNELWFCQNFYSFWKNKISHTYEIFIFFLQWNKKISSTLVSVLKFFYKINCSDFYSLFFYFFDCEDPDIRETAKDPDVTAPFRRESQRSR